MRRRTDGEDVGENVAARDPGDRARRRPVGDARRDRGCAGRAVGVTFTLLLVNDIYKASGPRGAAAASPSSPPIVKAERARGVPMLFCHAGDSVLALADVGLRPGRAHRPAHEHDPAGRVRARQPRVRLRQRRLFQAPGRGELPLFAANLRQADGSPVPGVKDHRDLSTLGPVKVGVFGVALCRDAADVFSPATCVRGRSSKPFRLRPGVAPAGRRPRRRVRHTDRAMDFGSCARAPSTSCSPGTTTTSPSTTTAGRSWSRVERGGHFVSAIDFAVTVQGEGPRPRRCPGRRASASTIR